MKILVTGSSGFLGKYTLNKLAQNQNLKILSITRSNTKYLYNNVTSVKEDLTNYKEISSVIKQFKPEGIVHLAWMGVYNSEHMSKLQEHNFFIIENLLQSIDPNDVKFFIGLGSQAEYGRYSVPIEETFKEDPLTIYGKVKLKSGKFVEDFCLNKGIRYLWLRLFSSFGFGDNPSWLIPYTIECLLSNKAPKLTLGTQLWDYLYVEDIAEAIKEFIFEDFSGVYNLGSGKVNSIRSIVTEIKHLTKSEIDLNFGEIPFKNHQIHHLQADMRKLFSCSQWRPNYSVFSGLKETINKYKETSSF